MVIWAKNKEQGIWVTWDKNKKKYGMSNLGYKYRIGYW